VNIHTLVINNTIFHTNIPIFLYIYSGIFIGYKLSKEKIMIDDYLFSGRLPLLNRALDAYTMRQHISSKNIANANTPNYRPERIKFEEEFQKAQIALKGKRSTPMHIPIGPPAPGSVKAEEINATIPKPEIFFSGDTHVNIDREMADLAENQIRYRMVTRITNGYFRSMQSAIKGGQ
jgi:flagellar basal-body rod protein FlgB